MKIARETLINSPHRLLKILKRKLFLLKNEMFLGLPIRSLHAFLPSDIDTFHIYIYKWTVKTQNVRIFFIYLHSWVVECEIIIDFHGNKFLPHPQTQFLLLFFYAHGHLYFLRWYINTQPRTTSRLFLTLMYTSLSGLFLKIYWFYAKKCLISLKIQPFFM